MKYPVSRSAEGPWFDFETASPDQAAIFMAEAALLTTTAIMELYAETASFSSKTDGSPVTLADERAEAIIIGTLRREAKPIPLVAEEAVAAGDMPEIGRSFILIDPLDGTKEFISRNGEFTVNIALIRDGAPRAGAVLAPALGRLWFGGENAYVCDVTPGGALPKPNNWRALRTRSVGPQMVAVASRSHADLTTEEFLARLPVGERRRAGSSLKFCVLAEADADVYPRFAPTMEWDTAAGDAVLRAAGGVVLSTEGGPLRYGKVSEKLRNSGFVAWGDRAAAARFGSGNAS